MSAVTVVEACGVRKTYGGCAVLDGVDLVVPAGQLRGLVGPNGAGKTTLFRVLLGLVSPDQGSALVLGAPAEPGRPGVAGFVEAPRFYPYLSGRDNLALLARLDGLRDRGAVDRVLDRVGLAPHAGRRLAGWSTGMRQRLGLAAALLRAPRLLVLDEPTSAMDPVAVEETHAILRELAGGGTAVVVSSHALADVASLCSHVTVLAGGTVRYDGTTAGLRAALPPAVHLLRTSDDAAAVRRVRASGGARVEPAPDGLRVVADDLDALVLDLAAAGIAVRRLVEEGDPLTRAFLELTA